jgi:hypothetical protein
MPTVGLNKTQADALNRHLACGKPSLNGFFLAAMQNGLYENFIGKDLVQGSTHSFLGIDADSDPYFITGAHQLMALRASDGTPASTAGIVIASGSTPACLRLTCRDVGAANVVGVSQEGSLWIPTSTSWSAQFEMIVPKNAYDVGVAFQEVGFMGAGDLPTHFVDASKEFGYINGSADAPFVSLKFAAGQGTLRVRAAAGGTILASAVFNIPASGKHVYRLEYGYSSAGGTPAVALFIDDVFVTSVTATIAGALQFAARACHGATYSATSNEPPALDLNLIGVAIYS